MTVRVADAGDKTFQRQRRAEKQGEHRVEGRETSWVLATSNVQILCAINKRENRFGVGTGRRMNRLLGEHISTMCMRP